MEKELALRLFPFPERKIVKEPLRLLSKMKVDAASHHAGLSRAVCCERSKPFGPTINQYPNCRLPPTPSVTVPIRNHGANYANLARLGRYPRLSSLQDSGQAHA
jgi:hypothetical protein